LIRQSDIKEITISLPDDEKLKIFEIQSDKFFEKIKANKKQIRTLETLRDTLLPKLMRGEVRVK
jgi:type I restriction enzyme S subunit